MYRRVEWMKAVDHAILSLLGGSQKLELTPNNIAQNIGYNNEYVGKRCKLLAEHGLLNRETYDSDPFYSVTERGEEYLAGDLGASELNANGDTNA